MTESFHRDTNSQNMTKYKHTHTHPFNVVFQGMVTAMAQKVLRGEENHCSVMAMGPKKFLSIPGRKEKSLSV